MSLVTEQLYIGNISNATNKKWLEYHKITHIVNTAVELNNYFPKNYTYLNLFLEDNPYQSLYKVFEKSYIFIQNAILNGGIVLVHCYAGISRSSSIVIYYLMKSQGWDCYWAYEYLKQQHPKTEPNMGFCKQLVDVSKWTTDDRLKNKVYKRESSLPNYWNRNLYFQ
jgi:protein-tyrosine phosphatase